MKQIIIAIMVLLLGFSNASPNQGALPNIAFDYNVYDFGTIEKGSPGICYFPFINNGDAPLVIDHITTSCGCTSAVCDSEVINPGKKGRIKVHYDTKRLGRIGKVIIVTTNARGGCKSCLKIKGTVVNAS